MQSGRSPPSTSGWLCQLTSAPNAAMITATPTAPGTIAASAHRIRPTPWVQVKRNVPVSNSRASTGAPAKAPTIPGRNNKITPGIPGAP